MTVLSHYKKEKERARKDRTIEDKKDEKSTKLKVFRLRHQNRRAKALQRLLQEGVIEEVPAVDEVVYSRYRSGRLAEDLDEATRTHGYGMLSTGECIGPFGRNFTTHSESLCL